MRIAVGQGSCGIAAGAGAVYSRLKELLGNDVYTTGCIGMCFVEPIVDIYDGKDLKKRLVKVKKGGRRQNRECGEIRRSRQPFRS